MCVCVYTGNYGNPIWPLQLCVVFVTISFDHLKITIESRSHLRHNELHILAVMGVKYVYGGFVRRILMINVQCASTFPICRSVDETISISTWWRNLKNSEFSSSKTFWCTDRAIFHRSLPIRTSFTAWWNCRWCKCAHDVYFIARKRTVIALYDADVLRNGFVVQTTNALIDVCFGRLFFSVVAVVEKHITTKPSLVICSYTTFCWFQNSSFNLFYGPAIMHTVRTTM